MRTASAGEVSGCGKLEFHASGDYSADYSLQILIG
jgi:hypothetical protein